MAERYIGIDLNEKYAMISFYMAGMAEPGTFSMVTGREVYQVPVCVARRKGTGQWIYGEEAKKLQSADGISCADGLLRKALADEPSELLGTVYDSSELLFLFLKKLMALPPQDEKEPWPERLVITVENRNLSHRKLFGLFAEWLNMPPERLLILDYRECFYYYALSQPKELWMHDVSLFYYTAGKLFFWRLRRDGRTNPQVVSIEEIRCEAMLKERDGEFAAMIERLFAGKRISCVYLIGDGFDGEWMKRSLAILCRGRRAFIGKNLFSKGACYAASVKAGKETWPYLYLGDNELRANLGIQVKNQGRTEYVSLAAAGENWYEAGGTCEVILSGNPVIDLFVSLPGNEKAVTHPLALSGLPEREDKTTRLRISAKPVAADRVEIAIFDMGFGEIAQSSGKTWEYAVVV